ncbi:lysylphosphatidylglycerol synthase transmembrane domain-containing protein [Agriterribacter sp.]|uniref:lysylphosphatidylglycerol synthase transmembrane domain-containing protein n=1 Tax=Agriterribacter sp. TaxID=2821509 RepID=UPI002BC2A84A|nr:lysylphosphatidylglycerol synthase transmembrane domain-containing protein [Agriterribacter sp.]HRO45505.1 lysylphosphatidylglycerol synthase transmembrane domain-containing protein [Agriterribacter sp.]HRQ19040.1 lysylphosphatidylglycerol synthase transmembrane domain-containing protein [Agriterribacter sp.]
MRKKTANALQYAFFLGLGIFLLWLSAHNLSPENRQHLTGALHNANYWLVIPAMILLMISHYSRALRWRILIRPLGYRPSVTNTFFATILGYFFNLLVPRLGEVMKCTILAKYEKIPADKLIGTMVTERVCDFLCLLIIIAITLFIQFDIIHQYASVQFHNILYDAHGRFKIYKMAIIIGIIAAVIAILFWLAKIFATSRFIQTIKKLLKGIWAGITSIKHMENKWLFLFHTFFIWTMYLLSIRIGLYTMEAVSHLGFKACLAILSFGSIAMLATQGGIGAYQYTIQKLLPLYAVAEGPALGFGWILWIAQTGIIIFVGILCLLLLPIINRSKYEIPRADQ